MDEIERIVDCTRCEVERGCCKRRKLMMAMCERIIQWLQEHKDELEDIDYADDVDLLGKCLIPRFEFPGIIDIKYGISTD